MIRLKKRCLRSHGIPKNFLKKIASETGKSVRRHEIQSCEQILWTNFLGDSEFQFCHVSSPFNRANKIYEILAAA